MHFIQENITWYRDYKRYTQKELAEEFKVTVGKIKTYEAATDGNFNRVRFAGGNAFMPTISIGVGHDLSVRKKVPLAWYVRLNVMQQRPYNTSNLIRFALEAGTLIPLKK